MTSPVQTQRTKRSYPDDVEIVETKMSLSGRSGSGNTPRKRHAIAPVAQYSTRLGAGDNTDVTGLAAFHPNHNHPDGSVIIHMEDQLFRLYRDTLERKSPYFKATFEEKLEPFSIANAITNSCPIVRIPEANAQHFAVLLDALEDFRVLLDPSFSVIASILVSSSELKFPDLRSWAVSALEKLWPDDYTSVRPKHIQNAAETVALAREYDIPQILKRAMYEIARSDDFAALLLKKDENRLISDDTDKALLSIADVQQLIVARERMSIYWVDTLRWYPTPKQDHWCFRDKPRPWKDTHRTTLTLNCLYDPILGLALVGNTSTWSTPCELRNGNFYNAEGEKLKEGGSPLAVLEARSRSIDWEKAGICQPCVKAIRIAFEEKQKGLWSKLGEWFGLTSAPVTSTSSQTGSPLTGNAPA